VRLPARFVDHAVKRLDEIESATVELEWWRSARPAE
jgi:hypothetical protein